MSNTLKCYYVQIICQDKYITNSFGHTLDEALLLKEQLKKDKKRHEGFICIRIINASKMPSVYPDKGE
jgi:hypothetical protein